MATFYKKVLEMRKQGRTFTNSNMETVKKAPVKQTKTEKPNTLPLKEEKPLKTENKSVGTAVKDNDKRRNKKS